MFRDNFQIKHHFEMFHTEAPKKNSTKGRWDFLNFPQFQKSRHFQAQTLLSLKFSLSKLTHSIVWHTKKLRLARWQSLKQMYTKKCLILSTALYNNITSEVKWLVVVSFCSKVTHNIQRSQASRDKLQALPLTKHEPIYWNVALFLVNWKVSLYAY